MGLIQAILYPRLHCIVSPLKSLQQWLCWSEQCDEVAIEHEKSIENSIGPMSNCQLSCSGSSRQEFKGRSIRNATTMTFCHLRQAEILCKRSKYLQLQMFQTNQTSLNTQLLTIHRRKCQKLLGFFINHVIFGVFQYDLGPPKHTLELRNFVLINVFSYASSSTLYPRQYYWLKVSEWVSEWVTREPIELSGGQLKILINTKFLNSKVCFGGPRSYWNTPKITWFIKKPSRLLHFPRPPPPPLREAIV